MMRVVEVLENTPKENQAFSQTKIAQLLGVSPRTIYNWRISVKRVPQKIGRPKHDQEIRRIAIWRVGREMKRQGYPGWRAIKAALGPTIPDRLIQEYVKRFKLKRRRRLEFKNRANRVKTDVLKPQIVWSMDSAHWNSRTHAQVVKDRASRKLVSVSVGPPVNTGDVIELLEELKQSRGLPLVLSTDNGSAFIGGPVREYLEREKVIHLRSLPRTPEHNSSVEVAIRDLREQVGGDPGLLASAAAKLNSRRLRRSLQYLTPDEFDRRNSWSYNQVREEFFRQCRNRIQEQTQYANSSREARMLERDAIHATLEERGWIKRWGSNRGISATRSENIS